MFFLGAVPVNSYGMPASEQAFSRAAYTVLPLLNVTDAWFNMMPSAGRDIPGFKEGLLTASLQDMDILTWIGIICSGAVVAWGVVSVACGLFVGLSVGFSVTLVVLMPVAGVTEGLITEGVGLSAGTVTVSVPGFFWDSGMEGMQVSVLSVPFMEGK